MNCQLFRCDPIASSSNKYLINPRGQTPWEQNRLDEYANNRTIQRLFRVSTWRSWRTAGLPGGLRTWSWMQDALKEVNGPTLAWIAGPGGTYTAKDHHFQPDQRIEKQIVLINDTRQPQSFTATWTATVGGKHTDKGQTQGTLAVSETRFIPVQMVAPAENAGGKIDGQLTLEARIGELSDTKALIVRGTRRESKHQTLLDRTVDSD